MIGRIWLSLGAGVLCLAASNPAHAANSSAALAMPPPAVTVAPVEIKDISPSTDYVGRVQAIQSVEIRAQVQGYLTNVAFQEGQTVKAGQVLFQIDRAPFEAALQSAKAQLERAQANLKQSEANFQRQNQLWAKGFQSRAVLDQAIAQRDSNKADIASAQAAVRTAEINLGFTTIKAPITGRIGRALVTKGNLVDSSTSPLASVVQVDPIRVVFSVPDRAFMAFRQKLAAQPGSPERRFVPSLRLPDGSDYDQKGEIAFIDNRVDPNTGTIAIWARFPNPDAVLLPDAFVTIAIRPEQAERRPLVPVAAVQEDRNGKFVLMLDGENTVREQRVEATRQIDQNWIVEGGLSGGERIVIDGLQKARPGAKVNPVPARQRPDAKT